AERHGEHAHAVAAVLGRHDRAEEPGVADRAPEILGELLVDEDGPAELLLARGEGLEALLHRFLELLLLVAQLEVEHGQAFLAGAASRLKIAGLWSFMTAPMSPETLSFPLVKACMGWTVPVVMPIHV